MILRIAAWEKTYENNESRKLKTLKWVAMPNKMNTQGYTALVDHPNAAAHFGAWCAIVEICSAREPREKRGTLPEADGTIPGISRVLGRISRIPPEVFEELLPRLIHDQEIKWIEQDTDATGESTDVPGKSPDLPAANRREGKGREGKGIEGEKEPRAPKFGALAVVPSPATPKTRKRRRTTDEIKKTLGDRLTWWEFFWKEYPCHEGMNEAIDAYERIVTTHDLATEVYRGAQRYAGKINADPTAKVKYAQGWLNHERWKDEIDARAALVPARQRDLVANVSREIQESLLKGEQPW